MPSTRRRSTESRTTARCSRASRCSLLLRAFSSGAVALSGVEAISNGVPAFQRPEPRNAAHDAHVDGRRILGSTFFGISVLAHHLQPDRVGERDRCCRSWARPSSATGVLYYVLQFSTFAILILAANTAYADFPRLSSIIASDGFLPRQLANRGDRLVFSNGVLVLAGVATLLIVVFGGKTSALIPLYAVGVFTGFTLSPDRHGGPPPQAQRATMAMEARDQRGRRGGDRHRAHRRRRVEVHDRRVDPGRADPADRHGAKAIGRHYKHVEQETDDRARVEAASLHPQRRRARRPANKPTLQALTYARSLAPDRLVALSVVASPRGAAGAAEDVGRQSAPPIALEFLHSPYRELTGPVLSYLDELDAENPDEIITVVIPEVVVSHWYAQPLHNQSALALKARLLFRPNTVVTSVPTLVE